MRAPEHHYGIDLGGTKIELVACDAAPDAGLAVRYRRRVATPGDDYAALVDALAALVQEADAALGTGPAMAAVGIGVPGIVDAASGAHLCANVPCLTGRELLPALRARLDGMTHCATTGCARMLTLSHRHVKMARRRPGYPPAQCPHAHRSCLSGN